jgi:hypothetical protein
MDGEKTDAIGIWEGRIDILGIRTLWRSHMLSVAMTL